MLETADDSPDMEIFQKLTKATCCPLVGVIVLNWKGKHDTRECCHSLEKITYPNVRIYVVDNNSQDGSAEALKSEFPQFIHIANQQNLGFSGGNNVLIRQAIAEDCQYILLLNNDTVVAPDFLTKLVEAAETNPQVGMVGAKICYFDPANVIWFAGGTVDFTSYDPFRHVGENEVDAGKYDSPGETGWVTGCCLLARSAALKQIGLLDESFGYYCEDVDWCLRTRRAGWLVWYEPAAKIWHKIGRSTQRANSPVRLYQRRNILLIARKVLPLGKRTRLFLQTIKFALQYGADAEKSSLLTVAIDGMRGNGGPITHLKPRYWCQRFVSTYNALRDMKNALLQRK